ncbi:hypothetical protein [Streptomyces xanthophaeus]|uniref:hypothetical protein n=1 Tax=Streptomyces xanthophaeus TaxID=67385 RepID=UPI0036666C71
MLDRAGAGPLWAVSACFCLALAAAQLLVVGPLVTRTAARRPDRPGAPVAAGNAGAQ